MTAKTQKTEEVGGVEVSFDEGGLFDLYRMDPDLDTIARIPGVEDVDFFRGRTKSPAEFKGGASILMPVFYYDLSYIQAVYTVDCKAVRELLPSADIHPLTVWPGRALVAFTAFQYRQTDIDPYNEFAISVITRPHGSILPSPLAAVLGQLQRTNWAFVWKLPVTTQIACEGGKNGYNYPKYVTDLPWEHRDGSVRAEVRDGAQTELTLTGRELPTRQGGHTVNHGMSFMDGGLIDVPVEVNPRAAGRSYSQSSCSLELGSGPISDQLRRLDLGRLVMYDYVPSAQLVLPAGHPLGNRARLAVGDDT